MPSKMLPAMLARSKIRSGVDTCARHALRNSDVSNLDQVSGLRIVQRALQDPLRQIVPHHVLQPKAEDHEEAIEAPHRPRAWTHTPILSPDP
jgi:hypothetical protein